MSLSFIEWKPSQAAALIDFITADSYPFNVIEHPTREQVGEWIDKKTFTQTFWILNAETPVGVMQQQDFFQTTAEVHIRFHSVHRGKGFGQQAIQWFTTYLFNHFPQKHRIEGWTRVDNIAMRTVFRRCGYVKEAHLRQDYPTSDGSFVDKIGYAILRSDWEQQRRTPVVWDDEPPIVPRSNNDE